MSTTDSEVILSPQSHVLKTRRRKLAGVIAVAAVLIAGLTTFGIARAFDHRYGPVEQGNFAGQYTDHDFVDGKDGFSYSLAPAPGATGQLIASLDNLGSHSVKVTSIDTDRIVTSIQWSPYQEARTVFGADTPWHSFPAIVPAHGLIRLLITIHHPAECPTQPTNSASRYYDGLHTVHWESLLHDHTSLIDDGLGERSIGVC